MSSPLIGSLQLSHLSEFDRQGYLVLPTFFFPSEIAALKARADQLLTNFDLSSHPRTIFRCESEKGKQTKDEFSSSSSDDYFLSSSDRIHYFFEEKAFDQQGNLLFPKELAINKIGHALHSLDPVYSSFTLQQRMQQLVYSLGFVHPIVLQSMIICKQPKIGGIVTKHRDSTFLYTEPSSAIGFWIALEDCDHLNGCLRFVPGSHKDKKSNKRLQRSGKTKLTVNNIGEIQGKEEKQLDGPDNSSDVQQEFIGEDRIEYPDEKFVPEPVPAGSIIIIHGDVVHASSENTSDKSRFIYTFHCIDAYQTKYPSKNWLQSKEKFTHLFTPQQEKEAEFNKSLIK
jgi:phytanoyl-CoA hydroxylase